MKITIFGASQGPICSRCYESIIQDYDAPYMSDGKLTKIDIDREIHCLYCGTKVIELVNGELQLVFDRTLHGVLRSVGMDESIVGWKEGVSPSRSEG